VHLRSLVAEENTPSLFIESIAEALSGLPTREQVFLRDFVLSYSLHWKRGQTS